MIFYSFLKRERKRSIIFGAIFILLTLFANLDGQAQPLPYDRPIPEPSKNQTLGPGYYVVVGAFRQSENAETMMSWLRRRLINYNYGYVPERDLFYVYAYQLEKEKHAKHLVKDVRERSYYDAWVYSHEADKIPTSGIEYQKVEDYTNEYYSSTANNNEANTEEFDIPEGGTEISVEPEDESTLEDKAEEGELFVRFITETKEGSEPIESTIYVYGDILGEDELMRVNSNQTVPFELYNFSQDKILTRVSTFGYKSVEKKIYPGDLNKTLAETEAEVNGDTLYLKYDLERYTKGDVAIMYAVYFYSDAAIMKAPSKKQLNELIKLLNEEENLEIQINGHTNGDSFGKIQTLKDDDNKFFGLSSNNKSFLGTAKRLSEERAEILKRYLVHNGIDPSRITTKGWGGEKPLYPEDSKNAINNMRVEIEVLKN
ncbi:OmpA family protein [Mangrovivirga sp. M17]|uniref:OmpA family protein n=1 Tax=Mangrovivirga halotolerans TaxID=2993936 RepID=A0ABT3RVJ2_9BACT|nr:OmpA family protein [Mangrovivirga halotolerans]MCX2745651.1 OmpA family protein [Mangrovivirga halotolerans]